MKKSIIAMFVCLSATAAFAEGYTDEDLSKSEQWENAGYFYTKPAVTKPKGRVAATYPPEQGFTDSDLAAHPGRVVAKKPVTDYQPCGYTEKDFAESEQWKKAQ